MENVFEELLAGGTTVDDTTDEQDNDFDHSYDLNLDDLGSEDGENVGSSEGADNADEGGESPVQDTNPTNAAFAQMRTQNKEYSEKIAKVEALAKSLGMENIDDFITKAEAAQVQREAKQKGISPEIAQELAEIRNLKNDIIAEREQTAIKEKEKSFASTVNTFIETNNLSKEAVDKLSQDLDRDGFELDALMAMPKAALNRVLSSYVGTNYQKNLERKNAIRKELPINQSSKIDTVSLNRDIDMLAKQLAGKM